MTTGYKSSLIKRRQIKLVLIHFTVGTMVLVRGMEQLHFRGQETFTVLASQPTDVNKLECLSLWEVL